MGGSQRGLVGNEARGVASSRTPAQRRHLMNLGKSDITDVVEGGHLMVRAEDPKVIHA